MNGPLVNLNEHPFKSMHFKIMQNEGFQFLLPTPLCKHPNIFIRNIVFELIAILMPKPGQYSMIYSNSNLILRELFEIASEWWTNVTLATVAMQHNVTLETCRIGFGPSGRAVFTTTSSKVPMPYFSRICKTKLTTTTIVTTLRYI